MRANWVESLKRNPQLLDDDPGRYYGAQLFRGHSGEFDEARMNLSIGDDSWLVWRVVIGRIEATTGQGDEAFRQTIPAVLDLIRKHPLARNLGLATILDRYRASASPTLNEALRDFALDAWGNPWLTINAAKWSLVRDDTREMVASWLKLALIRKFFGLLAEDGMNDTRRLKFWEAYHQSIHSMHFALGNTALRHPGADFKAARRQMEGLMLSLFAAGSPNNNAFIMGIGDHVVVEFGLKGNACFIFKRENLPFPLFGSVAGNSAALKHPRHVERLLHIDGMETWEQKFRLTLQDLVKVRPSANLQGVSPVAPSGAGQAHPTAEAARPTMPVMQTARPELSGLRRPTGTIAAAAGGPPFTIEALAKLCGTYRLRMNDFRPKGGNLWVVTHEQNPTVNQQLASWGFRYKKLSGWWRQ